MTSRYGCQGCASEGDRLTQTKACADQSSKGESKTPMSDCKEEQRGGSQVKLGKMVDKYMKLYAAQETKKADKSEPEPVKEENTKKE